MTLLEVKKVLRNGAYAWPGGYPMYFVTHDGAALSFAAVRQEWRNVVWDHLHNASTGWRIEGVDVNWEDSGLLCGHTGQRIESAYGED